jgi:3'(2'), 5'-bisphosphate nucleotidase
VPDAPTDDHALARDIAERAGRALVELRHTSPPDRGRALGDDGDRRAHALILDELASARPGDAVLSEEDKPGSVDASAPAGGNDGDEGAWRRGRLWIVDPLDGTREYSEGRADWAVHVALVVDGVPVVGAVALPAEEVVLSTAASPVVERRPDGPIRMLVSRTRPPAEATDVAERLGAELVPMGSAGAKTMAVVRNEGDVYLHAGGQYEWDSAAPVAVALAAGLHATRLDGSAIRYGNANPWLPDLLVCRPELALDVAAALRATAG